MKRPLYRLLLTFALILTPPFVRGDESHGTSGDASNWLTGENISLGGILFPHFHAHSAWGDSDDIDPGRLAVGGHDPNESGFNLQGIELGLSLRWTEYLEAFATHRFFLDHEDDWDSEWEEIFGKIVNIPGGFELRGGRYLNRFGFHNSTHQHAWSTIDTNLINGRFLGDEGLQSIGGEITWILPTTWRSTLSVSGGTTPSHDHHHHGGEHGDHHEESEHHEHGEEHHEEEEEHEEHFEAESALFDDYAVVANYRAWWDYNDFHRFSATGSVAFGENEMGRDSLVAGVGAEYLWSETGYTPGGKQLRWRNEIMGRTFDATLGHNEHSEEHEEEGERAESFDEWGFYSLLVFSLNTHWDLYCRGEFVSGIGSLELDERYRIAPGITWNLNAQKTVTARLQGNYDHSDDFGSEYSLWAQLGFNWGGPEVR